MRTKITRALLSVYDKTGVVEFARQLHQRGIELVSSGGTATAIAEAGIPVTAVDDITGVPPILDHRVVTLHPKIHGGILADRSKKTHDDDMATYGIEPFDLVVCYDVMQYLDDRTAARAITSLGRLTRGLLYISALTARDWRENCDRTRTDRATRANAFMRSAGNGLRTRASVMCGRNGRPSTSNPALSHASSRS